MKPSSKEVSSRILQINQQYTEVRRPDLEFQSRTEEDPKKYGSTF